VSSLASQPPTLEELFLRHYGDELSELEGGGEPAAASTTSADGHGEAAG
jgi:hypothetical protein